MEEEEESEASTTRRLLVAMLSASSSSHNSTIIDYEQQSSDINTSSPSMMSAVSSSSQSTWSLLLSALFYKLDNFDVNWSNFILALVLVMLMLTTAIGNLFVIVAILIERNLRTIGNYLVLSLAIADLLVACLVMPLAGIYQILERWTLGVLLCDIWTSADVFCCTASILHLLAIALDRYWAVTRVDYIRCQRNEKRILFMIFFVWIVACIISLAPVFGWKDAQFEWRITNDQECLISQDIGYQIFATCTTFYFPLTLTLIFYWKIYQVARKRIRRKPGNRVKISLQHPSSSSSTSSPGSKQQHHHNQQQQKRSVQLRCRSIVECSNLDNVNYKSSIQRQIVSTANEMIDQHLCQCSCHIQSNQMEGEPVQVHLQSSQSDHRNLIEDDSSSSCGPARAVNFNGASYNNSSCNPITTARGHQHDEHVELQQQQQQCNNNNISETAGIEKQPLVTQANGHCQNKYPATQKKKKLNDDDNPKLGIAKSNVDNQIFDDTTVPQTRNNTEAGQSNEESGGSGSLGGVDEGCCGGAIQAKDKQPAEERNSSSLSTHNDNQLASGETTTTQTNTTAACVLPETAATTTLLDIHTSDNEDERQIEFVNGDNSSACLNASNASTQIAAEPTIKHTTTNTVTTTSSCSKCRRCHWAHEKRSQTNGSERNYKGSSISSDVQSSCSPTSSLVNCATDYNDYEDDDNGVDGDGDGDGLGRASCGRVNSVELQLHNTDGTNIGGANLRPSSGSRHCVDLLEDCCGCCCDQTIPRINDADNHQVVAVSAPVAVNVNVSSGNRNRGESGGTMATAAGNKETGQQQQQMASQVSIIGERGLVVSELVTPPVVDSPNQQPRASSGLVSVRDTPRDKQHPFLTFTQTTTLTSIAICWRRLRAQLSHNNNNNHNPPADQSAAVVIGTTGNDRKELLITTPPNQTGSHCTILVDDKGRGTLVNACKVCQCANNVTATDVNMVKSTSGSGIRGPTHISIQQQRSMSVHPSMIQAAQTTLDNLDEPRTRAGGMVIAASTANIAVTTVRPQIATSNSVHYQQSAAEGLESKRERKAAKTLAIITGVFVMCWLPFFVMAITMPLLNLKPHKYVFALMLWLGYVNSMLNPIIYTIFSPDFRKAFKRLLCAMDSRDGRQQHNRTSVASKYNYTQSNAGYSNAKNNNKNSSASDERGCLAHVRRIHPMLAQCCLPIVTNIGGSSTKTTTTLTNMDCAAINMTHPSLSNRSKSMGTTGSDNGGGCGLIGNNNHSLGFVHNDLKHGSLVKSASSTNNRATTMLLSQQQDHHEIISTTGRPLTRNITNDF